ncbi:hypothetical protein LLR08_24175, partial [Rouxiella badensis]|uniref:hypothetical protein n=1 Tax=Rouxiella badensis TaxID=1646377 RepID=UPI001D154135
LSRMVDHIKSLLRPKSDQQFSHTLCQKRTSRTLQALGHMKTLLTSGCTNQRGAGQFASNENHNLPVNEAA